MELCLVQILVVVAIIQMRTLKAEVEKGSMRTAIGHGLLDPKARRKCLRNCVKQCCRKGMRLIFLKLVVDTVWQHKQTRRHRCVPLEEFSFLLNCFKPWIGLSREVARKQVEQITFRSVRCVHDDP